ncbi:hypothetical protein D3C87_2040400 [compost metagenome]
MGKRGIPGAEIVKRHQQSIGPHAFDRLADLAVAFVHIDRLGDFNDDLFRRYLFL